MSAERADGCQDEHLLLNVVCGQWEIEEDHRQPMESIRVRSRSNRCPWPSSEPHKAQVPHLAPFSSFPLLLARSRPLDRPSSRPPSCSDAGRSFFPSGLLYARSSYHSFSSASTVEVHSSPRLLSCGRAAL